MARNIIMKRSPLVLLTISAISAVVSFTAVHLSPGRTTRRLFTSLQSDYDGTGDDELIRLIRGPLGAQRPRLRPKTVLIVSDTTGVTAKAAVEKSLQQFNKCDERFYTLVEEEEAVDNASTDEECENLLTKLHPFVRTEAQVAALLKQYQRDQQDRSVLVVFTLADPALRECTIRMCELSGFYYVDLLGQMLDTMANFFDRPPLGMSATTMSSTPTSPFGNAQQNGRRRALSDDYFRRIQAVEYTLNCDDGMKPKLWHQADVVLCGVSRTGKSPLSIVLAQTMALRVANVPLVVELRPPLQLLALDPRRVFMLTLQPDDLYQIRRNRILRELQHAPKSGSDSLAAAASSQYADRDYLRRDLQHAQEVAETYGFTTIDVTGRAVEETASWIYAMLNERFPSDMMPAP